MKKFLLLFTLLAGATFINAQTFKLKQKIYGTIGQAQFQDMKLTPDGGYIMCGYADAGVGYDKTQPGFGSYDYWIVKANAKGVKQWDITLGGTGGDIGYSITPAPGGKGYLVIGTSTSAPSGNKTTPAYGGLDVWAVKLSDEGAIEWQKTYGGNGDDGYYTYVDTTLDGGYIIGTSSISSISGTKTTNIYGTFNFDAWVMKLDAAGNVIWEKDLGGTNYDFFSEVKHTKDSGFIVGTSSSSGISGCKTEANLGTRSDEEGSRQDYWIIKLDKNGNQLWDKTLGTADPEDNLFSVIETNDGGYVSSGTVEAGISGDKTSPLIGIRNYWVVKVNHNGVKTWDKTYGGSYIEDLGFLEPTADGGFVIGGTSASGISGTKTEANRGVDDYWLVKADKNGNQQWDKTIGGGGFDDCWAVCVVGNNKYIMGGVSQSGISGDKTSPPEGDGDYWITGISYNANGSFTQTNIGEGDLASINKNKFSVYPNPASNYITVQSALAADITVADQSGKIVFAKKINGTERVNVSKLPSGIYYVRNSEYPDPIKVIINH